MRSLELRSPEVLRDSLVVSASAGSGKTFTLTVLVCAALGRGELRAWEVVATTFSEASAADLRERLLRPLDLLAVLDESTWAGLLPTLRAGDPEGFGAVLRALPLTPRLARSVGELGEAAAHWSEAAWTASPARARAFWRRTRREAELLQVSTVHSLALRVLGRAGGAGGEILDVAHPALLRLLRQSLRAALDLPEGHPDHGTARHLLAWAERNWEALSQAHDGHRDALGHLEAEDPAPHRRALESALDAARRALVPFAAEPGRAKNEASRSRRFFKPEQVMAVPPEGAELSARLRWAEAQSRRADATKDYFSEAFREALGTFQPVADALEAWMRALLVEGLRAFEAAKAERGISTFGDLVRRALDQLRTRPEDRPAPKLLLVDEYQDISRAQDAFLEALGAARSVRVGDVKQAIYGFRGGDPGLLRGHLAAAGERAFRLPANFRSAPEVVALANRYVDEVWPRLDPGAGDLDGHQAALRPSGGPVGLLRREAPGSRADLAALADWIAGLSRPEGWDEALGAVGSSGPRRRALLLKQRTKLPQLLQRLKARGIQPYVVANSGFWDSPGVRLLMAALEAVAHPERPLPCAVLLRQVAGLRDPELARLAMGSEGRPGLPGLQGLARLDPERLPERAREAGLWLRELQGLGTQELAGRLLRQGALLRSLSALRVHGALEPLRARRNLAALLARILELPASPAVAFALLEDERNGAERGDLPAAAADADLLIQTAHASKGLEYEDVILPLLHAHPRAFHKGALHTGEGGELRFAWKLGNHAGAAYGALKRSVEARQRRDDLNLFYVALTRARERACLLLQEPKELKPAAEAKTWAQWGQHLAEAHPELRPLEAPPAVTPGSRVPGPSPAPPPARSGLSVPESKDAHAALPAEARARARQEGEALHAFLRDLLVRWEDPEAFAACLAAAPPVPRAREEALRFLAQFEARGWRPLRRRSELPLEGAAASGGLGRADLVVWTPEGLQLLDYKHSATFGEAELAGYRAQLARYAEVLRRQEGLPVTAWLVALRSGEWLRTPVQGLGS